MRNVYIPAPFMSTHHSSWALMQRCGAHALSWDDWAVKHRTLSAGSEHQDGTRSKQWLRFHHCGLVPLVWLMPPVFSKKCSLKKVAQHVTSWAFQARASKYMEVSNVYFNPVICTMFSKPYPHTVILRKERNQNRACCKTGVVLATEIRSWWSWDWHNQFILYRKIQDIFHGLDVRLKGDVTAVSFFVFFGVPPRCWFPRFIGESAEFQINIEKMKIVFEGCRKLRNLNTHQKASGLNLN